MKQAEAWAFRTFANIYPHEAYKLEPERFCNFVRTSNPDLSDKDIVKLLNETKQIEICQAEKGK